MRFLLTLVRFFFGLSNDHRSQYIPDVDYDPRKNARDERKARVAKNEKKQQQNVARASSSAKTSNPRKEEIDRTLASTRISTASMGKFDKRLDGEKKTRGVKRKVREIFHSLNTSYMLIPYPQIIKFDPTEAPLENEKKASLDLLAKMESDGKKMRREPRAEDAELNVRKAVRFASKGRGGLALGREMSGGRGKARGGRGGGRGGRGGRR